MERVAREVVPGALEAIGMLALFGLLMVPGFWLRFGVWIWEVM